MEIFYQSSRTTFSSTNVSNAMYTCAHISRSNLLRVKAQSTIAALHSGATVTKIADVKSRKHKCTTSVIALV